MRKHSWKCGSPNRSALLTVTNVNLLLEVVPAAIVMNRRVCRFEVTLSAVSPVLLESVHRGTPQPEASANLFHGSVQRNTKNAPAAFGRGCDSRACGAKLEHMKRNRLIQSSDKTFAIPISTIHILMKANLLFVQL